MSLVKERIKEDIESLLDRDVSLCFTGGGYKANDNVQADDDDKQRSAASIPPRSSLGAILTEERAALSFLLKKGVIQPPSFCPECKGKLTQMSTKVTSVNRFIVRCRARKCGKYSSSVLNGSIIANCRYSKEKFLDFCYHWLLGIKGVAI